MAPICLGLASSHPASSQTFTPTQQVILTRSLVWHRSVCVGMAMLCLLQLTLCSVPQTDRQRADLGLRPERRCLSGSGLLCLLAAPEGLGLDAGGAPVVVNPIIPLVLTL